MAQTLRYGDASLALFPDNTQGLIDAVEIRDVIVSQRSGGANVQDGAGFTVPIVDGVPVALNPLLTAPVLAPGLWGIDANNRLFPNYAAKIPDLIIPAGYLKFAQTFITIAVNKAGSGEDNYVFQLDDNGTPIGGTLSFALGTEPEVLTLLVNKAFALDSGLLLGLTVYGDGTGDDLVVSEFEMFVIDFQIWTTP